MSTYTKIYVCRGWIEPGGLKPGQMSDFLRGKKNPQWIKGEGAEDLLIPVLILIAM